MKQSIRKADENNLELQYTPPEAIESVPDMSTQHNLNNDEYELIESFLNE